MSLSEGVGVLEQTTEPELETEAGASLGKDAWRRLRRSPVAIIGFILVLGFVLVAIFAPWLAPYDPAVPVGQVTPTDIPGPSLEHPMGLDQNGRDELSRVIYGARQSLLVGVVSLVIGMSLGMLLGLLAGAFGGWVDNVVMRLVDIMLSIPGLLFAIGIAALLGQSLQSVMIAIAVVNIPIFARLLAGRHAREPASGLRDGRRLTRHPPELGSSSVTCCPTRCRRSSCRGPWCSRPRSSTRPVWPSSASVAPTPPPRSGVACWRRPSGTCRPPRIWRSSLAWRSCWRRSASPCWGSPCARHSTRSTGGERPVTVVENAPSGALLEVRDLAVTFTRRGRRDVRAVDGVSFDVPAGRTVALVGESGCGKSVTSLAIMGLLPKRGNAVAGSVRFEGEQLLTKSTDQMRDLRGRDIAMVFQDPMSSLNPVITIGLQVTEVLARHRGMKGEEARTEAATLLRRVGIPDPTRRLKDYPHQLSGGMRQRALIAMALACKPRLLIADEPTTALDVTIQAQILELLRELVVDSATALIMITHDLGVVAGMADDVHVMYSGRIVESAPRRELFAAPRHPYTGGLLASVPRLDQPRSESLRPIPGSPRDTLPWSQGCAFAPRCGNAIDACRTGAPDLIDDAARPDHRLRCFNPLPVVDDEPAVPA